MTDELRKGELMTIGGLGTYGSLYDVRVNQSTKVKNTASSDFQKQWKPRRKYHLSIAENLYVNQ